MTLQELNLIVEQAQLARKRNGTTYYIPVPGHQDP